TVFNEWHRMLELFSHFRLQYLFAALLLTIAFLMLRWPSYSVAGIATVALNAWFVVPWYIPPDEPPPRDADLKIMLSNVLATNASAERFIALVSEEAPDVVVIQEATPDWMAQLGDLHADYPHRIAESREDPFGIAVYSKLELVSAAVNASVPMGFPEIVVRLGVGERALNLITTHPMPPIGGNNYSSRNLQLEAVAQLAARTPEPLVVIGDLNITMWAHRYQRLVDTAGLNNARSGFGVHPSWPLFMPFAMIPIDHCLVSDGIQVTSFESGPSIGSDHLPIIVSLALD
ncbi:MAG: endonuclease/exonuclease/phosphatase family protein, partial [Pseudomonadota bacterium]